MSNSIVEHRQHWRWKPIPKDIDRILMVIIERMTRRTHPFTSTLRSFSTGSMMELGFLQPGFWKFIYFFLKIVTPFKFETEVPIEMRDPNWKTKSSLFRNRKKMHQREASRNDNWTLILHSKPKWIIHRFLFHISIQILSQSQCASIRASNQCFNINVSICHLTGLESGST